MRNEVIIDPRIQIKEYEKYMDAPVAISVTGDFDESLAQAFTNALDITEQKALQSGQKILPITIDSYGGDVYALNSCMDAIRNIDPRLTIATINRGKAMSAGAILFTCGHQGYRYMYRNATLMYHSVSAGASGTVEDMEVSLDEAKRLHSDILKQASKNIGKKENFFDALIKKNRDKDLYLDAPTAVELGIANKIASPRFRVEVSMDIKFLDK